ncbi:hypothetical protein B0H17DRAFT_1124449 [Mycena rosella]|uniref:RNA helicase n=1 Tax=Mycena rosella TaxID=1033263 RepID=A0AAD7MBZ3_MYCRO|nr:hypothetical protein B0H17DRAFT_1124449 [Mycena rosella]
MLAEFERDKTPDRELSTACASGRVGGQIPHPLRSRVESDIPKTILECIDEIGYKEPSAIQRRAIPIGLQNHDSAFVIPMLAFIEKLAPFTDDNRHHGPYALRRCRYVVLGFEVDLTFILDALSWSGERGRADGCGRRDDDQSGLRTSTWRKPAVITMGEAGRAGYTVGQRVEFVSRGEKKKQNLLEILNGGMYAAPSIVFVNQKKTAPGGHGRQGSCAGELQRGDAAFGQKPVMRRCNRWRSRGDGTRGTRDRRAGHGVAESVRRLVGTQYLNLGRALR